MSLRALSPPPRATTPEPILQPLPSPRLRPSRSIGRLKPLNTSTTTTTLSSHDNFHLTFDEFGTDHRKPPPKRFSLLDVHHSADSQKSRTSPQRTRKKSGPTSPSLQNHPHHHKPPRRSGSPPPPAHHHPTPPPPLPPLPSFLISAGCRSTNGYGLDIPGVSISPPTSSTSSDESVSSRYYPIHRSN